MFGGRVRTSDLRFQSKKPAGSDSLFYGEELIRLWVHCIQHKISSLSPRFQIQGGADTRTAAAPTVSYRVVLGPALERIKEKVCKASKAREGRADVVRREHPGRVARFGPLNEGWMEPCLGFQQARVQAKSPLTKSAIVLRPASDSDLSDR